MTAQKLHKTRRAEKRPKVLTAGNADDAFAMNEINVVHEVVNIALEAELNAFCIRRVKSFSPLKSWN